MIGPRLTEDLDGRVPSCSFRCVATRDWLLLSGHDGNFLSQPGSVISELATYMSGSLSFTGFQRAVCGVSALRLADPRPPLIRASQKGMSSITSPLSEIRRHVPVSILLQAALRH